MLALVVTSACSYSIAMPMTSSPLVPMQRTPIVDMKMWTYEECEAYGLDPRYVQDLEMRVDRLVQECEGDSCPVMPMQCIGDECMLRERRTPYPCRALSLGPMGCGRAWQSL